MEESLSSIQNENTYLNERLLQYTESSCTNQVALNLSVTDLTNQLHQSKKSNEIATSTIELLRDEVIKLKQLLKISEDRRADDIMRSRQIDYQVIQQTEEMSINFQKSKDINEMLNESLSQSTKRGDSLQERLYTLGTETEQMETKLLQIYEVTESSKKAFQTEIKKLIRENNALKQSQQSANETIGRLTNRCQALQEDALRATLHMRDSGTRSSVNTTRSSSSTIPTPLSRMMSKGLSSYFASSGDIAGSASSPSSMRASVVSSDSFLATDEARRSAAKRASVGRETSARRLARETSRSAGIGSAASVSEGSANEILRLESTAEESDGVDPHPHPHPDPDPHPSTSTSLTQLQGRTVLLSRYLQILSHMQTPSHCSLAPASPIISKTLPQLTDTASPIITKTLPQLTDTCSNTRSKERKDSRQRPGTGARITWRPVIDLSRCGLTDQDLPQLIEWIRLIPLQSIVLLNFSRNLLCKEGLELLVKWLTALPPGEGQRAQPLDIDISSNRISEDDLEEVLTSIRTVEQPNFPKIEMSAKDRSVRVYGHKTDKNQKKGIECVLFRISLTPLKQDVVNRPDIEESPEKYGSPKRIRTAKSHRR